MMYVSGETAEPSHETTGMVEEIVRQQVIEMVCDFLDLSYRVCVPRHLSRSVDPHILKAANLIAISYRIYFCVSVKSLQE